MAPELSTQLPGGHTTPRTWLLLGHKVGDNAQLQALAETLGWPYEARRLAYRRFELLTNLLAGPNLLGLVPERCDPLEPPWPQLVLSAGRRNEPVARWLQMQGGGREHVKLVHVGRPWARLEAFDLVITTPQYSLPQLPNVLQNEAPLHRISAERLAEARATWEGKLRHLPRPYIAVVLGGHSGPYTFSAEAGAVLGWHANRMARTLAGSLLITTSARTPANAIDALRAQIDMPFELFRWHRDAAENPYFGFLALADRLIVTCETMSMLIEAIATGRPVFVFDLARGAGSRRPAIPAEVRFPPPSWKERLSSFRLQPLWYRLGQIAGPAQLRRDVSVIQRHQIHAGRAAWLGDPVPVPGRAPPLRDNERAADRVRALFEVAST